MKFLTVALVACVAAGAANAKPRRAHAEIEKPPAPAQAQRHSTSAVGTLNGAWSVEAAATVGACPGLIPDALEIADSKVAAPGLQGEAWGYVDAEGVIVARFTTADGRIARFHGNLRGGHGSGAWSSSTDMCGGTWRAALGGRESAAQ